MKNCYLSQRWDGVVNVIGNHFALLTLHGEKIKLKVRDFR